MKLTMMQPVTVDVERIAIIAPPQDVLEQLGTNRIELDIDKGTAFAGGEPISDFDAIIGLGVGQRQGTYIAVNRKGVDLAPSRGGSLPVFLPHDPARPGIFRLTVRDGAVFVGDEPWRPTAKAIQAWIYG
jgi:hypothetical protein